MRTFRILTMALLLTFGLTAGASAQGKASAKKAKTETVVYDVSLSCGKCKAKIEKNIPYEKGVKDLRVNLDDKTVTVVFDPKKTDKETIRKAIEKLDFTCAVRK